MKVTLQSVSDLRRHFGDGEIELDVECSTVRELLDAIRARYGFDIDATPHTMLFLNGRGCVDHGARLREGDHVAIVPILAAG
ncbi:MAG: MoaD/ThiS family protein [bacterium]|nr:MoaD/ThiS family protein [bacterium]